jgi:8-oxo-dGTP diphosphatase
VGVGDDQADAGQAKPAPAFQGSSISAVTEQSRSALIDKVAWIYLKDRRVLSTRSAGEDVYYLPGGKRETGESDLETLIREIQEELSVRIDAPTVAHLGTFEAQAHGHPVGVTVRMTCYVAGCTGELAAANEIAEIAWLTMRDRERVSSVDKVIFDYLHESHLLGD